MIEIEIDAHALQEACRAIGYHLADYKQFDLGLLTEALSTFQSALDDYAEQQYISRTTY